MSPLATATIAPLAALAAAAPALAQELVPCFVSDTSGDTIWSCVDLNADGDYNDAGELRPFYDDSLGTLALTNNVGMLRTADGQIYVADTGEDSIVRLLDVNGDGDAHDLGEARIWFNGRSGAPGGIVLNAPRGMWRDADGTLFVANAGSSGGGVDAIVRLRDLNLDGDADDPGESSIYYAPPQGGAVGDSIPTAVARGADGALYYVESGTTGFNSRGVWRLADLDQSGAIDAPGEARSYFQVPTSSGAPFFWDLAVDDLGRFYISDTGNDFIWRFLDRNVDGMVDPATEADILWTSPGMSLIWEVAPAADGSLYAVEDQSPDRLIRLVDRDGNGTFGGPGEFTEVYSEGLAAINIGSPKAIALAPGPGSLDTLRLCSPAAINSTGASARIEAFGSSDASANDLILAASALPPDQFGFFFTAPFSAAPLQIPGSAGFLCIGGGVGRYSLPGEIKNAGPEGRFRLTLDTGAIRRPNGNVPAAAGDTYYFQAWFRDVSPEGSNLTDAIRILFS